MDLILFESFQIALAQGDRQLATIELNAFIGSFVSLDEKASWTRRYLANGNFGHKIRHELYEQIIFPVLLSGYRESDPWSLRWLERTSQNLYENKRIWSQVDWKTATQFASDLFAACPTDNEARLSLLSHLVEWLRYSIHEWPAGILYGKDGATLDQCQEIFDEVEYTIRLDEERAHAAFLEDFKAKLAEYARRLTLRP